MPISIQRIQEKEITIGVVGLGYVGLPLSLAFAEEAVKVIGFDIDEQKTEALLRGQSYLRHINHGRLESPLVRKHFKATSDFSEVRHCDAVIICVPTPLDHHMEPDLRFVRGTCEAIAPHIQPGALVSLESTTYPGTTEEIVVPILEKDGRLQSGENLFICFSPEREDPGNRDYTTKTIPKIIGADDLRSRELAEALYSLAITHVVPVSSTKVAETVKLFENIFRSVNIALVNEMKMICDPMGIDVWEVIRGASTKPFGFMPFWPGPGLGGHCIPIDPFYLSWKAKEFGLHTRFIELAGEINRAMPKYVVIKVQDCLNEQLKPVKGSKILILGLAYKPDVDDVRESPSFELIELLEKKGAQVDFNDPYCPKVPATREHGALMGRESQSLSGEYDCFVIATHHSVYSHEEILSFGVPVVDTRNLLPKSELVYTA